MFKKKQAKPKYNIYANKSLVGSDIEIFELPLAETAVIEKSIEFYNDPCPCYIHRNAVMARMYEELSDYCTKQLGIGQNDVILEELPGNLRRYLNY